MKRVKELSPGVFVYSNGQIGTRDLPLFVAECAYFKGHPGSFGKRMLMNLRKPSDTRDTFKQQLARAYASLKRFRDMPATRNRARG